ncbi:hypothetical protein SAMN06295989_1027 [Methanohalophilus euhalobius]|uniref:Uncharacterized protein n=1 Tax=Methanohalophilus euhalobius TaxID=51203 RepID=A0A285EWK3_9EURY|nr:hypothetical protein SAMN06295989_1027 [Methanohalophilus euhalobius]
MQQVKLLMEAILGYNQTLEGLKYCVVEYFPKKRNGYNQTLEGLK